MLADAVRLLLFPALMSFAEQVSDALTELSAEMRRMQDWLEHDRPRHWKSQIRRAGDQAHEAQQALHRCLMFPIANERPSCTEERTALKKAQARLAYCQDKEDKVRRWQQTVRHELFEYEGRMSQLVRLIEGASGIRPSIRYAPPRDGDVRDSMADISAARAALEFRHESWFAPEVYEVLRARRAALCIAEDEDLATPLEATAGWGYLRLRRQDYGEAQVKEWAQRIRAQAWSEAYVFFKHEDEGKGPQLAAQLVDALAVPAGQ